MAENIAATVCTVLSIPIDLKFGAAATNNKLPQVKNDKNYHGDPTPISNQAGSNKPAIKPRVTQNA